jgi:hypothetical protein
MNCNSKRKLDYKEKAEDIYSAPLRENRILSHQYRLVYLSGKNMLSLISVYK